MASSQEKISILSAEKSGRSKDGADNESASNLLPLHGQEKSFEIPKISIGEALVALRHKNSLQRAYAARAIGDMAFLKKIKIPEAVDPLSESLLFDVSDEVREEAAWALWKLEDPRAAQALFQALSEDDSVGVKEKAARALGLLGMRKAVPLMIALLSMGKQIPARLRAALVSSLGILADERASKIILHAAVDAEPTVRYEAVRALGRCLIAFPSDIQEKAFLQILKCLHPRRERVASIRQAAMKALRMSRDRRATEVLAKVATDDPDAETRRQAVEALLYMEGEPAESAIITALEDSNWGVKKTAGFILAERTRRTKVHNAPRVCEALARMERMFPSGSREWRLAAMAFASL